jgi:hypothetical protein
VNIFRVPVPGAVKPAAPAVKKAAPAVKKSTAPAAAPKKN